VRHPPKNAKGRRPKVILALEAYATRRGEGLGWDGGPSWPAEGEEEMPGIENHQLNRFHKLVSKKLWFGLFNVIAIGFLVISGRLRFETDSLIAYGLALFLMNVIALISARNFPDWK
jgi:hypothetical protein